MHPTSAAAPGHTPQPEPVILDWSKHTVDPAPMDDGGLERAQRCHLCGKPAWMRDDDGKPCHKVCAEDALTRDRAATGQAHRG